MNMDVNEKVFQVVLSGVWKLERPYEGMARKLGYRSRLQNTG